VDEVAFELIMLENEKHEYAEEERVHFYVREANLYCLMILNLSY
jgi:hypothetical protein